MRRSRNGSTRRIAAVCVIGLVMTACGGDDDSESPVAESADEPADADPPADTDPPADVPGDADPPAETDPLADEPVATTGLGDTEAQMPAEMTTVRVGIQPVSSVSYLHLGVDKGFFADRNIEIEFVDIATSDVGVTSLASNQLEFATVNPPVLASAIDAGLPIRWATAGTSAEDDPDLHTGMTFVRADSDIQSFKDLEGKRAQVPCVQCIADLWTRAAIAADGGDPDSVEFVAMATADAPSALEQGNVDSISAFASLIPVVEASGARAIGDQMQSVGLGQPVIPLGVNTDWASDNLDVVEAFTAAEAESADYAAANNDEWRSILPDLYPEQVPDLDAAQNVNGNWKSCIEEDVLAAIVDYMVEWGWVDGELTVGDLFLDGFQPPSC